MVGLDAAIEKKEAENRAANIKVNQVVAVDSLQLPELPNAEIERKESLQILFCPPIWKPPDAESPVVTSPTPPKPSESFESHLATTQGDFIGSFHSSLKQKEQPPPKPPDAVQLGTVLLRRVPLPKPPDLGARVGTVLLPRPPSKPPNAGKPAIMTAIILVTAEESISGELMRFMSLSVEKDLEKVRVRWGINDAVRENGSMDKVGISFNPMDQTHTNFCRILKGVAIWAGVELLDLVQFNESNGILKKGVHIAEDTNLKEQDIGSNWSCCKLGPTENQIGQAQNNSRWVREIQRWSDVGSLKLAHVSVVPCVGIRPDTKVQIKCFTLIPPLVRVSICNVKFKFFKQAGGLQGVDETICLKEFIRTLPMCSHFSLIPIVKLLHEFVVIICANWGDFLATTLIEIYGEYSHVSWAYGLCDRFSTQYGGFAFWYALLRCYMNEVYEYPFEHLGDTWAEKVQTNNATIVLELSPYSHNRKIGKGPHVYRMIKGYDVMASWMDAKFQP
ncbi:unnamed protein product [Trifolium pratense]|uniref:Uncharacterized protein n=1 Tax=Trifolium pratense TaxID=57577 RepID=A0ACB0J1W9_TRIPR|nr:unnamed protein product [Trifolium pratense]